MHMRGLNFLCACRSSYYSGDPKLTSARCAALALPRLIPVVVYEREPKEGQIVDAPFWLFPIMGGPPISWQSYDYMIGIICLGIRIKQGKPKIRIELSRKIELSSRLVGSLDLH